ncbi:MAG: hypothetical protein JW839_19050 [Candidatus Lokiarchaeota archaeon]|nr:hypothetical protein [Candidatus Lokiarchaeota archaeon]
MVNCHDMKLNDVYKCPDCGLELKVVKECVEHCSDDSCEADACPDCGFQCCGKDMLKI